MRGRGGVRGRTWVVTGRARARARGRGRGRGRYRAEVALVHGGVEPLAEHLRL